jgi:long-chain acyl-CoA synthetase
MEYVSRRYRVKEERIHGQYLKVFDERPKTLSEMLRKTVEKYGSREGFVCGPSRWSFDQFFDMEERLALGLQKHCGVRKGERIAILMNPKIEFTLTLFSSARIGAIAVPLNTRFTEEELAYEINNSESSVLIIDEEFGIIADSIRERLKTVRHVLATGSKVPIGTFPLDNLLNEKGGEVKEVELAEDDTVMLMYTSGTTGFPKGAMQFHRGIIHACMLIDDIFEANPEFDRMLNALPMFHSAGTIMSSLAAVFMGISCVYLPRFKTKDLLETIQKEHITLMVHVPTVLMLMVNQPQFEQYDLRSLRTVIIGGAPKSPEVVRLIRQKLPQIELYDTFGMTETHTLDCILEDKEMEEHIESVGRVVPVEEIKIVDPEGKEVGENVSGEILIRGPKITSGYWKNMEETQKAIKGGWLHTGDVGKRDEKGYVYLLDRMKDMIIRGGENIYSVEIENVLMKHPKVAEAAVVGVPDKFFGEEVKAYVLLRQGLNITEDEIKDYCKNYLADYKIPKLIEFVQNLPRNPAGKIMKGALRRKI